MTEPRPDDLFDTLRDRLTDYGQQPPAHLWAGIRQQLPGAVPPRRRVRWRWGVGLLAVLLAGVLGVYGLKQRTAAPTGTGKVQMGVAGTANGAAASGSHHFIGGKVGASNSRGKVQPAAAETNEMRVARNGTTAPATAPVATPALGSQPLGRHPTISSQPFRGDLALAASLPVGSKAPVIRSRRRGLGLAEAGFALMGRSDMTKHQGTAHSARQHARVNAVRLAALASRAALAAGVPSTTADPIPSRNTGVAAGSASVATTALATPVVAPVATLDRLGARLVPLALSLPPDPAAPQPIAVPRSQPPRPLGSRWAVQVLAGPALTYRYLGPAVPLAGNVPVVSPTSVAELERPALGYGAQASLRRTLTPHWNLSLGLGYAEYANALALLRVPLVPYITNPIDTTSATSIHRRDTYRFLTVPLRLGYAVAPSARWRLGLLAGADAAIYAGGTSTEGTPCACQTQTWAATGPTPYRRLSLSLSLGLEARYRLSERWELLAQPSASYFLNALPRPDAGAAYAQRYLWGGTLLLGISHDL